MTIESTIARQLSEVSSVRAAIAVIGYSSAAPVGLIISVGRYLHVVELVLSGIGIVALLIAALGIANALFADGAAAMVGKSGQPDSDAVYRVVATGSTLLDDCADAMTWRIGDHGFEMTLSPRVPELIGRHVRPWLADWLALHGQTIETVGSWAVHPGGPRILSAFGEAVGLDRSALDASYGVLAEFGNMSSPTIAFILQRLLQARAPRPCVALAFGPGLAAEAALLD